MSRVESAMRRGPGVARRESMLYGVKYQGSTAVNVAHRGCRMSRI